MSCKHGQVVATVLATAAVTAGLVELLHYYFKNVKSQQTRVTKQADTEGANKHHDEALISEQLARTSAFLGDEGLAKLKDQFVVVVGAGGVGSNCIISLIRSGVCKIRIIDFDQVSLSSLNRHACATLKDVGTSKVECLKKHILQIAPWCEVELINELWNIDSAERLIIEGNPTFVVDCIDNIDTKVDLLEFVYRKGIPVISSMGAACKSDPSRVNIGDISKTEEDPLAKSVRRILKKRGIISGIPVVFSAEKPSPDKAKLLPLPDEEFEKGSVEELSALKNFRVRILPVLGTMPAMFGLAISSYVITTVSGYPVEPIEGKNRMKLYDALLQSLAKQQLKIGKDQRCPVALSDILYIVEEIYHGKSPISNYSTKLGLSRWKRDEELSCQNVVLMTKKEIQTHEDLVLIEGKPLEEVYSPEVIAKVEARFEEERWYSQFRT